MALVALGIVLSSAPTLAACIPPSVSVQPLSGPPGTVLTVRGSHFFSGCPDVIMRCPAGETCPPPPRTYPIRDITVTLVQGERTWALGTIDAADDNYKFTLSAMVPGDVQTGSAIIRTTKMWGHIDSWFKVTD